MPLNPLTAVNFYVVMAVARALILRKIRSMSLHLELGLTHTLRILGEQERLGGSIN